MDEKPGTQTPLLDELTGSVAALVVGAAIGFVVPLKGEGAVTCVVDFALVGWVAWKCRNMPKTSTVFWCALALVVLWPIVFAALDLLHQSY
jgi:hypothetical protein